MAKKVSEYDQEIPQSQQQTKQCHRAEKPQNTNSHKAP